MCDSDDSKTWNEANFLTLRHILQTKQDGINLFLHSCILTFSPDINLVQFISAECHRS